ncbi:D(2) dopamine receptor B-like [Strongylocentrotus purpuratus]|uniref:G-protein coupled receptors family 1 profile domain-containing protein n=1 Tax=Strongylocentrotus purpuratus TaxID=7668 RepID=A0A7M7P6C1_STRPU|nr:D(2) dopamine receptor B-like [Strongylocentrotus purpuratus]
MAYNVYATIVALVCEFLIPLTVIIALNSAVYVKIRNRAKGLKEMGPRKVCRSERVELKAVSMESNRTSPPVLSEVSLSDVNVIFPPPPHLYEQAEPVLESSCVNCINNVDDHQTIAMHLDNETGRKTTNATAEAHKSKREYARHLRAAIVLAVLVTVFIACWLPYQIVNVINAICDECVSDLVWEIVNNILWCNSFVNPFLYAATNVHFRRNFIILLGLHRFRCFRSTMHAAARPSSTADRIRPRFRRHQQQ